MLGLVLHGFAAGASSERLLANFDKTDSCSFSGGVGLRAFVRRGPYNGAICIITYEYSTGIQPPAHISAPE